MPLEEEFDRPMPSIDEIQYGKEIADKIQQTLGCAKQVEQNHQAYFDEIERPISDFVISRWGNDIGGIQTSISGELRPDIAQELNAAIAKVWES